MSGFWRWIPGKSVGPFTFGERIESYIEDYDLQKRRTDCSIADWETYELLGFESWVIVDNGRIIEVYCADEVEYANTNILGMQSSDIRELLGSEDTKEDNVGLGYALYYDKLGLTLFVVDSRVSAVVCGLILTGVGNSGPT